MDVVWGGKGGLTVGGALRAARKFIPLVMLTARTRPEDVLQGFESGADDYLPKPFNLAILIARVGSLLRRKTWLRASTEPTAKSGPSSDDSQDTFPFGQNVFDLQNLPPACAARTPQPTLLSSQ